MLMQVARCNHVHLAATISQSINLTPLYFETHESLGTKQVWGWSIIEESGGVAHSGYVSHYSWERFTGAGAFFCGPTLGV